MYNRYIPQPDGTYRRNRMQEAVQEAPKPRPRQDPPIQEECPCEPEQPPCQKGQPCTHAASRPSPPPQQQKRNTQPLSVGSFLRRLLPRDFDTEDLLVVILLLLMAGDCQEEQNSALLTLALYLFL